MSIVSELDALGVIEALAHTTAAATLMWPHGAEQNADSVVTEFIEESGVVGSLAAALTGLELVEDLFRDREAQRDLGPPSVFCDDYCLRFHTEGINCWTARFPSVEAAERAWTLARFDRYVGVTVCHALEEVADL